MKLFILFFFYQLRLMLKYLRKNVVLTFINNIQFIEKTIA